MQNKYISLSGSDVMFILNIFLNNLSYTFRIANSTVREVDRVSRRRA